MSTGNQVHLAFQLIERFDKEGQAAEDHLSFSNPRELLSAVREKSDLVPALRRAHGHYYSVEALLRVWLFVSVPEYGADDAAEMFIAALDKIEYDFANNSHYRKATA